MADASPKPKPELDPLREQLLDAAARVFASKGYAGTKIMDIVKEAGLSSGAVYGRFESKDELLTEAVLQMVERNTAERRFQGKTVAEILVEMSQAEGELDDAEAIHLEAFVAARRSPAVAKAIAKARKGWRRTVVDAMVQQAIAEGDAVADADFESIIYFIESLQLGLIVQRGAGRTHPDPEAWQRFIALVIRAAATTPKLPG
jgi:AcrR family transcriptional regulator